MKLSTKAQASIDKVINQFKTGDLSPISEVVRIRLDESAPARKWSLSNKVLAYMQAEELDCRGYVQWQKLGRKPKKGSKAVYIFRPHTITKTNENEEKETMCVGFSTVPVFPASCTEGNTDIPTYMPQEMPPLAQVAQRLGIQVSYVPVVSDRLGDCQTDGSTIRLGTHDASVFFHELAHAIQAKVEGGLHAGQNQSQETVAEFTSAVLMQFYGFEDTSGKAWQYISQYAPDPLIAITKALATVEKVLVVLLDERPAC